MKRFILASAALVSATPAFAHGGAHVHPHGFEGLIMLGLVAGGVAFMALRK